MEIHDFNKPQRQELDGSVLETIDFTTDYTDEELHMQEEFERNSVAQLDSLLESLTNDTAPEPVKKSDSSEIKFVYKIMVRPTYATVQELGENGFGRRFDAESWSQGKEITKDRSKIAQMERELLDPNYEVRTARAAPRANPNDITYLIASKLIYHDQENLRTQGYHPQFGFKKFTSEFEVPKLLETMREDGKYLVRASRLSNGQKILVRKPTQ